MILIVEHTGRIIKNYLGRGVCGFTEKILILQKRKKKKEGREKSKILRLNLLVINKLHKN